MHNNYFFIRQLSLELKTRLSGAVLVDCFSQNKDELVMGFLLPSGEELYIVAVLTASFSSLYIPAQYHRARKNSITLFDEIIGRTVKEVEQVDFERFFILHFSDQFSLGFKLFGNRSNIVLWKEGLVEKIFKSSLKRDRSLEQHTLGKNYNLTYDNLQHHQFEYKKGLPVMGDIPVLYLEEKKFLLKSEVDQKSIWENMLKQLQDPRYYVTRHRDKYILSLLPIGDVLSTHSSAIEALNAFYQAHYRYNFLEGEKDQLLQKINRKEQEGLTYIQKCLKKMEELEQETSPSMLADIIMANLHSIPAGATQVRLFDFYTDQDIDVKLKQSVSPQKFAETLYRKAKGRPREIEMLKSQVEKKQLELSTLKNDFILIQKLENYKELEAYKKKYQQKEKDVTGEGEQFKVYEIMGYKIYVGRNAENNEELTQRFAKKNDLWLHVRDVSGSHVVIKHQAGKNFPKPLIEAAASLAAYYSKRKNESLCPVIYTEKKFVRKIKGTPAGQMKVEKENVIMVVPRDLTNAN